MARDNVLLAFVIMDILFVVSGGLLLVFALMMENDEKSTPTITTVATNLLLLQCPLQGKQGACEIQVLRE